MGLLEALTLVFVVCKLIGLIDWSWWFVLLPTLFSVFCYIVLFIFLGSFTIGTFTKLLRKK